METAELTGLRRELKTRVDTLDDIEKKWVISDDGLNIDATIGADDYRRNLNEAQEIKSAIEAIENRDLLRSLATPAAERKSDDSVALRAGAADPRAASAPAARSIGDLFVGSDEFKAFRQQGGLTMPQAWEIKGADFSGRTIEALETKDVFQAAGGTYTTQGFGRTQRDPMVPRQFRTVRVRDLFPTATTDANLIEYFRVAGFVNNAATVAQRRAADETSAPAGLTTDVFGRKPQSRLTFEVAQAPVRTIAHWEAAHRHVLDDEPQLRSTIDNELLYGLRLEEDDQILNGDGTGENLLGILNTPGVQTYTQAAAPDTKADAIRRAATRAILAYYEPTGVVLHPYDWEDIELLKDDTGRYVVAGSVTVGADTRLWRMPVIDTPAMAEGSFLTGAFGLGAQLYDREIGNIRVSEHHQDFFVRNAVVILAEQRLALAVKRPESFVLGTFL